MPEPAARILVVDDHELTRRVLCSLLAKQEQWSVESAPSGPIALGHASRSAPDVVVLDVFMPEMSGLETAYELRKIAPHAKIVFISGHFTPTEASVITRIYEDSQFVEKANSANELVQAVSACLAQESTPPTETRSEAQV